MADIVSRQRRSIMMSNIKSKNTKPELIIRSLIHGLGYRFRLHRRDLPGKPDLCFPSLKKVIYVNGCFWHSHGCSRSSRPKTNTAFWVDKLKKNVERDKKNSRLISQSGWSAMTLWECQTQDIEKLQKVIIRFLES